MNTLERYDVAFRLAVGVAPDDGMPSEAACFLSDFVNALEAFATDLSFVDGLSSVDDRTRGDTVSRVSARMQHLADVISPLGSEMAREARAAKSEPEKAEAQP